MDGFKWKKKCTKCINKICLAHVWCNSQHLQTATTLSCLSYIVNRNSSCISTLQVQFWYVLKRVNEWKSTIMCLFILCMVCQQYVNRSVDFYFLFELYVHCAVIKPNVFVVFFHKTIDKCLEESIRNRILISRTITISFFANNH